VTSIGHCRRPGAVQGNHLCAIKPITWLDDCDQADGWMWDFDFASGPGGDAAWFRGGSARSTNDRL
jgi:hypothetical protein